METKIQKGELSQEVKDTLKKYNTAIDWALAAAQKLEAISITAHLADMFWSSQKQTMNAIKQDYLVGI